MPMVEFQGKKIHCQVGDNLRQVLLKNDAPLYNGKAKYINCMGIGSCGTCAVQILGEVNSPNWKDKARRFLWPHSPEKDLRLACQTKVLGDIKVIKYAGFWGEKTHF
ncbi:(2Fe-2S)-binding protein [Cyanobacterium stanieri LEGE 03274]|uniref:(2Fe-2S)-binding protein n=1 Tax=Cyanobacterium stanieri LEGE 03274 TaxID=1828756 RepID=A0ABR9V8H4_9CHRO|nr:2Fe-2S iron-sulfur cluster-binding protein [Cyanobacterium stanieri]MBE9223129.1 (2Fe-2S)-binding protein [Cyanobacterium stanieri LEGE 03274]